MKDWKIKMSDEPKDPLPPYEPATFSKEHIGRCYRAYRNRDGKLVEDWCAWDDPWPDDCAAENDGTFTITSITGTRNPIK